MSRDKQDETCVTIKADAEHSILITVIDHGPYIPVDKQGLIFECFYRVNKDSTKGIGLGLALVKQIMSVLGGSVQLTNRSAKGLDATLLFPATGISTTSVTLTSSALPSSIS